MNGPDRLTRWMLESQQPTPYSLSLDHPAQADIAWAADRIAQLEKDYDYAVETIQEIVNRVRPLLPVALANADSDDCQPQTHYCPRSQTQKTHYCPQCHCGDGF